jgi:hypothetical protein
MKKEKPQNKALKTENEVKETQLIETKEVSNEVQVPSLEVDKVYEFVANGTFHTLPKGTIWTVTGETAMIFLKKGYGKLK